MGRKNQFLVRLSVVLTSEFETCGLYLQPPRECCSKHQRRGELWLCIAVLSQVRENQASQKLQL